MKTPKINTEFARSMLNTVDFELGELARLRAKGTVLMGISHSNTKYGPSKSVSFECPVCTTPVVASPPKNRVMSDYIGQPFYFNCPHCGHHITIRPYCFNEC